MHTRRGNRSRGGLVERVRIRRHCGPLCSKLVAAVSGSNLHRCRKCQRRRHRVNPTSHPLPTGMWYTCMCMCVNLRQRRCSSMVTAGATANTTEKNSRASMESGWLTRVFYTWAWACSETRVNSSLFWSNEEDSGLLRAVRKAQRQCCLSWRTLPISLYKILCYFTSLLCESIILLLPPPTCKAYPITILLHDRWAI